MSRLAPALAVLLVGVALLAVPAFAPSEPRGPATPGDDHTDEFGLFEGLVGLFRAFVGSLYAAVGLVVTADGFRRNRAPSFRRSCGLVVAASVLATVCVVISPWEESQLNGAFGAWVAFSAFAFPFAVGTRRESRDARLEGGAIALGVGSLLAFTFDPNGAVDAFFGVGLGLLAVAVVGGPLYALGRRLSG